MAKIPSRLLSGAIIIILFFLITNNIGFLLFSIICTGGITLVIYVPAAYLVGFAAEDAFINFVKKKEARKAGKEKKNNKQVALKNYVMQAGEQGIAKKEIINKLLNNGWSKKEIDKVFSEIK